MRDIFKIGNFMVLVFIVFSCSSDDDTITEEQVAFPEIIGVWEWVGTTGGIAGTAETPESSGITRDIIITDTNFTFYLGDEILAERDYAYTQEISTLTGLEEFIVTFEDNGFRDIIRREDDFINFIDDCNDCYTSVYRVKN